MILRDECYSEIYTKRRPAACSKRPGRFRQCGRVPVAVEALEPAGHAGRLCRRRQAVPRKFIELRNVAAPQVPVPLQHVAIAAYSDEAHVEENRRLYRMKFDLADQILGNRYGYRRPAGGFCVWLDVSERGGDEDAAMRLYRDGGVRVVPGSYLARQQADGSNPGAGYIRARAGAGQRNNGRGVAPAGRNSRISRRAP